LSLAALQLRSTSNGDGEESDGADGGLGAVWSIVQV